jgi:hypothetical protein
MKPQEKQMDARGGFGSGVVLAIPQRVQLSRKKGWKMPPNTVVVSRPSKWGNPYDVQRFGLELAVELFARTMRGIWNPTDIPHWQVNIAYDCHTQFLFKHQHHPLENLRSELTGKNLGCWCPIDKPCHADVLLRMANSRV